MAKKTVLVTGIAGFIGSHVADECLKLGYDVVGVDDLSGGVPANVPAAAKFIQGSVSDRDFVNHLFERHKFVYVYHLAAYAAEGLSHFIRNFNYTNNLIGSVNLINGCVNNGVDRFVFTSSIAVYGAGQSPMTEDMVPVPEDPYGIAKYAVEMDLRAAAEMFGMSYVIFRPHNVYGERQNIADKYRNVIGIFMNQLMQGRPMSIFGDGEQQRAFSHISDVAPIIARSAEVPEATNQTFNIGADTPYTINELALTIADVLNVKPNICHHPARNEVKVAYASHDKCRRVFGGASGITLREGLRRMAEWARAKGAQPSADFACIEIDRNLPPSWKKV